jgi:Amt family ammonium transporter
VQNTASMKKTTLIKSGIAALAIAASGLFTTNPAFAQEAVAVVTETVVVETAEAAPAEPTVEQRIADLEAYVNNGARTPDVASKIAGPGPGHNAWQMTSTVLVLFMTLPGLALFYGGLVRSKNVLSILAMTMGIAGLVTILWFLCGYSLTFSGGNAFLGDLAQACFNGMKPGNVGAGYYWISDYIWAMFQLTFAIITPALIFGATAERMKFSQCFFSPRSGCLLSISRSPTWSGPSTASCAARSTLMPASRRSTSPAAQWFT